MISHVMDRKMRLSKLLFIAMVALCLVFMRATAEPGDEVAVEGEGEAVVGGQGGDGGAEVGESHVAPDVVRSQVVSTRGPTRSQMPSKGGKNNKVKIAIVIGVILLLIAAAGLGYYFGIRPMQRNKAAKANFALVKEGFEEKGGNVKMGEVKLGKDKSAKHYIYNDVELSPEEEKIRKAAEEKLTGIDICKKKDDTATFNLEKDADLKIIVKTMGLSEEGDRKKLLATCRQAFIKIVGNKRVVRFDGPNAIVETKEMEYKKKSS